MQPIAIRPLAAPDFPAWSRLWQGYLAFYKAAVADDVTALSFSRLTGGEPTMGGFLAWRGDEAVGMVNWITHKSTWTAGDYCYLQDLFTAPEARGAGVGRLLIDAVGGLAEARGCSRVHWLTQEGNVDARALYDKLAERSGFIQYRQMLPRRGH
jgi:GNAT superfamily N-acetyltransferase